MKTTPELFEEKVSELIYELIPKLKQIFKCEEKMPQILAKELIRLQVSDLIKKISALAVHGNGEPISSILAKMS